jgi:hypothetical protein
MILWLAALGYASVLIYVFAVDPKPRMMFVPFAITNIAFALLSWRMFQQRRAIIWTLWVVSAGTCLLILFVYPSVLGMERSAEQWIAEHPNQIEIDENTRRHLALVPVANTLPNVEAERPFLLYRSTVGCDRWVKGSGLPPGTLRVVASARASRLESFYPQFGAPLCLLHYERQIPGDAILEAFRRSREDGNYVVERERTNWPNAGPFEPTSTATQQTIR